MSDGVKFFVGYVALTVFVGVLYNISLRYKTSPGHIQQTLHDVKMADGQPADEFILGAALKFFDAGCVDALERMKQVDPKRNKGDPESYCGPRTEQVRKELVTRGFIK